ncbi:MAG: hypothetical protein AB7P49_00690 [Bdellovibrionales bacterium]
MWAAIYQTNMDKQAIISKRIRDASGSSNSVQKKENLTWKVSDSVQKWINGLVASIVVLTTILLSIVLFFVFVIAVIRGVGQISNYPMTVLAMGVILFVAWARWIRGSMFLKTASSE